MKLFDLFSFRLKKKPRVLLLVDRPGWAFDHSARQIVRQLSKEFSFDIRYVVNKPIIKSDDYDLLYVFFWGEKLYQEFGFDPEATIKEVSSHRWEDDERYGPCIPPEFVRRYLNDAGTLACTSHRLFDTLRDWHPHVLHTPNGINPSHFYPLHNRHGSLTIGWAGNANDPVKRFNELFVPAVVGKFDYLVASGDYTHRQMNDFYNKVDLFVVSSKHEGEPLTLLEAMAAGCFPICVDVGIVPEVIRNGENGLIVDPTPDSFIRAFQWCKENIDTVRMVGKKNADFIRSQRSWPVTAPAFLRTFHAALDHANRPKFRNDDLSADTSLGLFSRFCEVFHKHGYSQLHGVTLYGNVSTNFLHNGVPVEYEGNPSFGELSNDRIRELSGGSRFEDRLDLIDYINASPDDVALHGLYHTDYSAMTPEEQRNDIVAGLETMYRLFPKKRISYFIAPFNRTNSDTYTVCKELNLKVLAGDGVHLESELNSLQIRPRTWYRYHHHRFYQESKFSYYTLSLELLDEGLKKGKVVT